MAMQAGQQHILICVHLAKAQGLVGVVTNHVVAVDQLLCLRVSILTETEMRGSGRRYELMDGLKEEAKRPVDKRLRKCFQESISTV